MDTKELIESIITSDEESLAKFVATMEERISDALEVRKVELASGMMSEEELDETTVGRLNSYVNKARNDKSEAEWTAAADHPRDEDSYEGEDPERDRLERRAEKRGRGIELARAKMNKSGKSGNTTAKVRAVRDPRAQVKPRIKEEVEQVDEVAKWRQPPRSAALAALGRGFKRGLGSYVNPLDDKEDKLASRQFAANITNTKDPKTLASKYGVKYAKRHGTDLKAMIKSDRANEEVEQMDEADDRELARTHNYWKAYAKKTIKRVPGYNAPGRDVYGREYKPKNEEVEQIDEVSAGKYAAVANRRGNPFDADTVSGQSEYSSKKLGDVVRRASKKFGSKVGGQLANMQAKRDERSDAYFSSNDDKMAKPYPSYHGPRTTKSGMLNKTAGRILKQQIRDRLNKEEFEQIDEAGLGDMEKLRLMGDKNRALTMMAMKRYQQVGDINKLSPAHRTLVNRYMQNQVGSLDKVSTSMQRAALRPTKDQ